MEDVNLDWYALSVRSRHEFMTTELLRNRGVEVFLPSISKMRRWSDRSKAVTFPLFPGYVFVNVRSSAENFLNIVKTRGAVSFVSLEPGYPTRVDPQEMNTLKRMIESGEDLDIYPHLSEGAPVLVKRGPLQGAAGVLAKKNSQRVFLVNINILGRSIGTKINAEDIEHL